MFVTHPFVRGGYRVMRLLVMVAVVAGGFAGTPALAEKKESGDPDKIICRTEPVLGSRTRRNKICATAAEWKAMENDGKALTKNVIKRSGQNVQGQSAFGGP